MMSVFGRKKKEAPPCPAPKLNEASEHIDDKVKHIDTQISKCDEELLKYKNQIAQMKRSPLTQSVKQKALNVLKRKKMYEQQREQLMGTQFNLDQVQYATEQLQTTALTVDAMKTASTNLKQEIKKINLCEIEKVQEDLADLMMDQEEINEILSNNYALPSYVDETELDAEFAALEEDMETSKSVLTPGAVPSYLPSGFSSLPKVPDAPLEETLLGDPAKPHMS